MNSVAWANLKFLLGAVKYRKNSAEEKNMKKLRYYIRLILKVPTSNLLKILSKFVENIRRVVYSALHE